MNSTLHLKCFLFLSALGLRVHLISPTAIILYQAVPAVPLGSPGTELVYDEAQAGAATAACQCIWEASYPCHPCTMGQHSAWAPWDACGIRPWSLGTVQIPGGKRPISHVGRVDCSNLRANKQLVC